MFRTLLLIAYIGPGIYIFLRLRKYVSTEKRKKYFTLFFGSLMCVFPCVEFLSHSSSLSSFTNITKIGYYSLPYLLYLFLAVLLFDITFAVNHFVKFIPVSIIKVQTFRRVIFAVILIAPILIVTAGAFWHGNIQVNSYHIEVPKKSSDLKHLKIAFAADLHLKGIADKIVVDNFVTKINSLNPDLVLFVGDIIEGDRQDGEMTELEQTLRKINSKYGVYAAFGNHESHGGNSRFSFYNNAAIKVLQDTFIQIDKSFYLVGRNDSRTNSRKTIEDLFIGMDGNLPIVMLDHRPSDFNNVSHTKVDVQVSGHTHNGQLFPLNYIASSLYDLSWGHKKISNTNFFVTSGLQAWGPAVKTAGASEIVVINIDFI